MKFNTGSGIRVYFENKKEFRNVVFFPNGAYTYYRTGGMLFELIRDDAMYLITEKAEKMIRAFPDYNADVSKETVTDGFRWLCGAIDDDDLPVASELFRSCFSGIVHDVAARPGDYGGVGEFFLRCYAEYLPHIQAFAAYTDAVAAHNSGVADEFQEELAQEFLASADELFKAYTRKCSVRHKNEAVTVDTVSLTNFLQVLTFETCRMKKEHRPIKICANCGRYFIPPKRSHSIYCPAPSPQNPEKTCAEVAASLRWAEKRRTDPVKKKHYQIIGSLANAVRRSKNSGASNEDVTYFQDQLNKEIEKYKLENNNEGGTEND